MRCFCETIIGLTINPNRSCVSITLSLVVVLVISQCSFGMDTSASVSIKEIHREIREWQAKLESFEVVFSFDSVPGISDSDAIRSLGKAVLKRGQETFGMKGNMRRLERKTLLRATSQDFKAEFVDGRPLPESERLSTHELHSFNGKEFRTQERITGLVVPPELIPHNNFQSMILANIAFLPPSICASDEINKINSSFGLPGALSTGNYSVTNDHVEGSGLLLKLTGEVQASGGDTFPDVIWLDQARGYVLIQREIYGHDGMLSIRFRNSDFREAAQGIWLPYWSECEEFVVSNSVSPAVTNRLNILSWKVNSLSDDYFDLQFKSGTIVSDYLISKDKDPVVYTIPVNASDLDEAIRRAVHGPKRGHLALIGAFALAIVTGAVWLLFHRATPTIG